MKLTQTRTYPDLKHSKSHPVPTILENARTAHAELIKSAIVTGNDELA
jgi:hypothetical protein